MPKCASLGELITALYDAASELDGGEANAIVAVATIDVLLRQRRRRLVAELADPTVQPG
ncbi:MAG TPA: hypothetical protein VIG06_17675 [Kofleriaceae bacterium]|jgi:hypothetical protein